MALRYDKSARQTKQKKKSGKRGTGTDAGEQYQLFDTAPYEYRVFVTTMAICVSF